MMSLLQVTHLSKQFGEQKVLQDVSFSVEKGEFLTLLGPSGSGKSTLFHIIGGIQEPNQGFVYLNGKEITGKRGFISYMPQNHSLFPWRTVLQNVLLGGELQGKKDKEMANEMLNRAGLEAYVHAYPRELSGGMKQRVAFIRALLSPQSVLCLDEPFSALDELTRQDMQKWLLSIWDEYKKTVLFITHSIDEALFLSDRILIFSEKPTGIKAEIKVPFPRPRNENLFLEEEFFTLKREIYSHIAKRRMDSL